MRIHFHPEGDGGAPAQPTVAQLQAEIAQLKKDLAAAVSPKEHDRVQKMLDASLAELAELKKAPPAAAPDKSGFFPRLF